MFGLIAERKQTKDTARAVTRDGFLLELGIPKAPIVFCSSELTLAL